MSISQIIERQDNSDFYFFFQIAACASDIAGIIKTDVEPLV